MRKVVVFAIILLFSTVAFAESGSNPVVAPDGAILVIRPGVAGTTPLQPALVAVSRAGSLLWTWQGSVRMHTLAFDATQVFFASGVAHGAGMNGGMMGGGRGTPRGGFDSVVALSVANGSERWRRELPGTLSGLQLSGDRLFVVVHAAGTAMPRGGMSSDATFFALDAATGTVIWKVPLQ